MVERFEHPDGLLYFEMFWHLHRPASRGIHLVRGEIRGDGPWKVGDAVVSVLGCQGTNPECAVAYAQWQAFLEQGAPGYPFPDAIQNLARQHGVQVG